MKMLIFSIVCAIGATFCAGMILGRASVDKEKAACQYMNELHEAGFRFYDPEGYEIDRWAE